MTAGAVYAAALEMHAAGLCVVPPKEDGTKAPAVDSWKRYQSTRSTREEIDGWYAEGQRSGIGVVLGPVSGNREAMDFDCHATYLAFVDLARSTGLGDLVERIEAGDLQETPGGGRHWSYCCDAIEGNTKLARRLKRPEEMRDEHDTVASLIETRGAGGYIVVPPSNGRVHPSGRPYRQLRGNPITSARITPAERDEVHALARSFDAMPKSPPREPRAETAAGGRPGDDYNRRGDVAALLEAHGWTPAYERNGVAYLRRPGKDRGVSATLGYGETRYFYPFTSSTAFDPERAYSPFAVYAILEHAGDFGAAADALAQMGYGEPRATPIRGAAGRSEAKWPLLDDAALYGLAGDVVRTIAPHTEGDPVAILFNLLTMFGSATGAGPFAPVGATRHRGNLFGVVVGETARSRKGTSYSESKRLVALADELWAVRIVGGLSSGEGLIHAVRDAEYKVNKEGDLKLADPGVDDKRLLVVEEEFSSVMRVAGRDGNTLSELLRRAWDGNDLRTLTRNSPLVATSPHVSVLGHITRPELLRELSETNQVNGFANRFLFLCVRRSKLLPHGGAVPEAAIAAIVDRVRDALDVARRRGAVRRDAEANAMWEAVYPALTAERPGMLGAITARAEAQVLRLSLLYALLDRAAEIRRPHLEAALALWQYAEDSARFVFGDATGDPVADQILSALRTNGKMTQTQISELFGKNQKAGRLQQALTVLLHAGTVRTWQDDSGKGGRPPVWWEATA